MEVEPAVVRAAHPSFAPWARTYPIVVERGNYVHNQEHGGVVLLYNCPDGCPDIVDGLSAIGAALPQDPACPPEINARWIVTGDPLLPDGVRVAAAAWGWTHKATCLDTETLSKFITARYAQGGPENTLCN